MRSVALNQIAPHQGQVSFTHNFIPCSDKAAEMASKILEWRTDELPVGKGATVQQFVATLDDDQLQIAIAPWGEGHLKINGREIAYVADAKDRRQAFRAIKQIAGL
jgi:hypothetical protein